MSTDPSPESRPPRHGGWLRPVALIVACLVLGFLAGWVLRGDDGTVTILDAGAPDAPPALTETDGSTTPTAPATTPEAPPPPDRSTISLAILNGTDTAGLAGERASEAESIGYQGVVAGNAPTSTDPSTVYHAADQRPAAQRVARDLAIGAIRPLPASGGIADAAAAAAPDADVVVVLGPS